MMKGQRRPGNGFDLSEAPSHLIRRCQQFYGDLYAREAGGKELTKQQFTLLCALEQNDGASQTALVEITGIDRSTLAEMVRRMLEKGLLSRERTEEDQRANAVAISPSGRKALRGGNQIDVAADHAAIDEVIRLLDLRIVQARFLESGGVCEAMYIGDVNQLNRCHRAQ